MDGYENVTIEPAVEENDPWAQFGLAQPQEDEVNTDEQDEQDAAVDADESGAEDGHDDNADNDHSEQEDVEAGVSGNSAAVDFGRPLTSPVAEPPAMPDTSREDALIKRIFQGQENPYTGRPVETVQDYLEYEQRAQEDALKEAGISKEQLNEMISNAPVMQEARAFVQRQEMLQAQAEHDMAMAEIDRGVKAIMDINPEIKSLADIAEMETFPVFDRLVKQGYALEDAYKIANMDDIINASIGRAEQKVRNSQASKSHLRSHQGVSGGENIVVPKDVAAAYREMIPGITDDEIIKDYAKNNGGV